jgi:hypothetical protein
MTPGWSNVRNGLSASYDGRHVRCRRCWILGLTVLLWMLLILAARAVLG